MKLNEERLINNILLSNDNELGYWLEYAPIEFMGTIIHEILREKDIIQEWINIMVRESPDTLPMVIGKSSEDIITFETLATEILTSAKILENLILLVQKYCNNK